MNTLVLKHFASYISAHKNFWETFICKDKWVQKEKLSDVAGEIVLVLYSRKLRRRTELLERDTKGLYFLYCYCETDGATSAQELSRCLWRMCAANLRSDFSEVGVLYPFTWYVFVYNNILLFSHPCAAVRCRTGRLFTMLHESELNHSRNYF